MIWKKITIETKTEAADIVASVLFDNGIVGVEIEDNQNLSEDELKKMYVDIPLNKIDDGIVKVSFYVSLDKDGMTQNTVSNSDDESLVDSSYIMSTDNIFSDDEFKKILNNIKSELDSYRDFVDMGSLSISETELDDKVFLNKWKENFTSTKIDDIQIFPSWEKNDTKEDGSGFNIYIEPGSAFGTGKHPTTSLCVKALREIIKKENSNISLLDVGVGSGILSIIAMKLGVKNVVAIDIDKSVESNLLENLKLNNINSFKKFDEENNDYFKYKNIDYVYGFGNILIDKWVADFVNNNKYDIIVANILAPVIISLLGIGNVISYLKENGYLVLSGIIKEKEGELVEAIKNDKSIKDYEIYREDEWLMFKCTKAD